MLGSTGHGTSITAGSTVNKGTTSSTSTSASASGPGAIEKSIASTSGGGKTSSPSTLVPMDYPSTSTSTYRDDLEYEQQKVDQKLHSSGGSSDPVHHHHHHHHQQQQQQSSSSSTATGASSSTYPNVTNIASPQRMRPATRSLLKWAASAKGSFRRISRMSSFTSRTTKERSASTDRDSSTGKSDSFDSPNDNNVTY